MKDTDLIEDLDNFRVNLQKYLDRLNKSGVQRTNGLKTNLGADCPYYKKSRDIFLNKDYEELKRLFLEVLSSYRTIEGKEFGNNE